MYLTYLNFVSILQIEEHLNFLHAEFDLMVIEERSEDLRNVYTLLRTLSGALRPLLDVTFNHIKVIQLCSYD